MGYYHSVDAKRNTVFTSQQKSNIYSVHIHIGFTGGSSLIQVKIAVNLTNNNWPGPLTKINCMAWLANISVSGG
jgi:hypothetical protein